MNSLELIKSEIKDMLIDLKSEELCSKAEDR